MVSLAHFVTWCWWQYNFLIAPYRHIKLTGNQFVNSRLTNYKCLFKLILNWQQLCIGSCLSCGRKSTNLRTLLKHLCGLSLNKAISGSYSSEANSYDIILCLLTSKWVLCMLLAGQNNLSQCFAHLFSSFFIKKGLQRF